jgi:hypothetical protein
VASSASKARRWHPHQPGVTARVRSLVWQSIGLIKPFFLREKSLGKENLFACEVFFASLLLKGFWKKALGKKTFLPAKCFSQAFC